MKLTSVVFILFTLTSQAYSQNAHNLKNSVDVRTSEKPPTLIDDDNGYLGGTKAYNNYVGKILARQAKFKNKNIHDYVLVEVYVNPEGKPIKYEVFKTISKCRECTTSALNILRTISAWKKPSKFRDKDGTHYSPKFYLVMVPFN